MNLNIDLSSWDITDEELLDEWLQSICKTPIQSTAAFFPADESVNTETNTETVTDTI